MKQTVKQLWLIVIMALTTLTTQAYDITIVTPANGMLTASKKVANKGETINVMASANTGYILEDIVVDIFADANRASARRRAPQINNTITVNRISDGLYSFTMPDYDVEVSAKIVAAPEVVIQPTDISTASVTLSANSFTFNGKQQTPDINSVTVGGKVLTRGTDYTVTMPTSSINAGSYVITITGQGDYKNTVTAQYSVLPKTLTESMVSISQSTFTYNGAIQKPVVAVKDEQNGVNILKSDYFEVSIPNSQNKGDYNVMVMGKGNYTGLVNKMYTINGGNAGSFIVTLSQNTYEYDGTAHKPAITVKNNGKTLSEGVTGDYTLSYRDNVNAGTATVTVTGQNNFGGQQEKTFSISQRELKTEFVTLNATQFTYNGEVQRPEVIITDGTRIKDSDYALTFTSSKNAGSYQVVIVGKNNYRGTVTKSYNIGKQNISGAAIIINEQSNFVYDGKAKTPSILEVTKNGETIPHSGYNVTYSNNINAGTALVTATGQGNYMGTATHSFTITKKNVTEDMITLAPASFTYTGTIQKPAVTVKNNENTLVLNTDYTLTNTGGTNTGTYMATIEGKGNYQGVVSKEYVIDKKDISSLSVNLQYTSITYDGIEKIPSVIIKDGTRTLSANTDYTIALNNNKNVGNATISISGINNYKGSISKTFYITPKILTDAMVELSSTSFVYNTVMQRPEVTVKDGNTKLLENNDFSLSNAGGTTVGTYSTIVTGRGNYEGTVKKEYTIKKATITGANITLNELSSYTYDGTPKTPSVIEVAMNETVIPRNGYDIDYANNINAGTATVKITGKGNYDGSATQTFTIEQKEISSSMLQLSEENFIYNGKTQHPTVTVKNGSSILVHNADYSLTYEESSNVGNYQVTVKGLRNYNGEAKKQYSIIPKDASTFTLELLNSTVIFNGEAQKPKLSVMDETLKLEEDKHYAVSYKDNVNVGTATVTITGKGDYSGTASKEFSIIPKQLTKNMITVSDTSFIYNNHTQKPIVTVKDGTFLTESDYQITNNGGVNVGSYNVNVKARGNYAGEQTISYSIKPMNIQEAKVILNELPTYVYDGQEKRPSIREVTIGDLILPTAAYSVEYTNNINVGKATVKVTGKNNFEGMAIQSFDITSKVVDASMIDLSQETFTYNGKTQRPIVTIKNGKDTLKLNTDYSLTFNDSARVGEYTVKVHGLGNYSGEAEKQYVIIPKNASTFTFALANDTLIYNGCEQKPAITVKDDTLRLEENLHFTITYKDNVNVGKAEVTITGKGDYSGSSSKEFVISPKKLQREMVTLSADSIVFNGQIQKPVVTVKDSTIMTDADYRIINEGGYNIGTYEVKVKAMGNYTGEETFKYEIVPLGMEVASVTVSELSSYIYDGQEKRPAVREVSIGDMMLPSANYDVSYTNNINAGEATIHISGNGNFSGEATRVFTILPKEITKEMLTLSDTVFVFNGDFQLPEITMMDGKDTLTANEDYDFTYNSSTEVGIYKVTIDGKNNYTGTIEGSFRIAPKDISGLKITYAIDTVFIYNGKEHKPEVLVQDEEIGEEEDVDTLIENGDYTLTYSDNVNAGTATITIEGMYCYEGTYSLTFDIQPRELTEDMVSMTEVGLRYDGTVQKPEIAVSDTILITEDDYTIYNPGGIDAGDYTVTVTGKRNYQGKVTLDYEIMKALLGMTRITGMTKPETGELFDTIAYCRTKGIKSISPVKWTPADSIVMPETVYKGSVVITADENHMFNLASSGYIVSVNGEDVLPDSITGEGTIMTVSYTFEPTMAQTEQPMEIAVEGATVTDDRIRFVVTVTDEETKEARIDRLIIEEEASSITKNLFIPAKATMPNGVYTITDIKDGAFLGNTNVTDIYMPESDKAIYMSDDALLLTDETSDETKNIPIPMVRIHTPLSQLADYALMDGLEDHFNEGKIMSTATAKNRYWTFSCGVDVVMPEGVKAYTVNQRDENTVEITELTDNELVIGNSRVIKAGNGILFGGEYMVSENTENDSIGNDSIPEDIIPEDSIGNDSIPEDIIPEDSIGGDSVPNDSISRARMRYAAKMIGKQYDIIAFASRMGSGDDVVADDQKDYGEGNLLEPVVRAKRFEGEGYYVLSNNTFHAISNDGTSTSTVPACKAVLYIEHADGSRILKIATSDATAIEVVKALTGNSNTQWFDINGRRINRPTKKGHYIMHNGENSKHILIK